MSSNDIAAIAKSCSNTIETTLRYATNIPKLHDWLEVQAARLNIWADALGVYARYELSVAFRLAKNEVVAKTIVQLLKALSSNLRLLQIAILPKSPAASTERQHDGDFSDSGSFSASDNEEDSIGHRQGQIEDDLRRLTYIAIKVRREGMGRSSARAATFEPLGDDGEPLETEFGRFIDNTLKRAFDVGYSPQQEQPTLSSHPDGVAQAETALQQYRIPDYLRERLRKTMLDRWRRISYQRHHAAGLATTPDPPEDVPDTSRIEPQPSFVDNGPVETAGVEPVAAAREAQQISLIRAPKTTATETPADFVIPKEAEILPKAPGTMATSVRAGELSYPRMPLKKEGIEVFACPFCGQLQPSSLLDRKRWQRHVMQDLSPYFCLFEDCPDPYLSYQTTEAWVQHCEDTHSQDAWLCNFCPRGASDYFRTPESYTQHLTAQHSNKGLNEHAIEQFITLGCQRLPPKLPYCVLCGFEPEAGQHDTNNKALQEAITDHIAKQHMEVFALDSMPWDIPGADEDSAYGVTHQSHTDSLDARDDVLDDEEIALDFPLDDREKQRLADDPSLSHILHAEPESLASSLETIKSATKMIFDKRSLEERLRDKIELWRRKEKLDQEGQPLPLNGVQLNEPQEPGQDSNQWAEERLKKVIEWISPSDQEYIHESARAKYETHTNDPILKSNIYEAWKSGDIRHIWIHGKAGSGKTVLCSSIVQNMFEYCRHTVNVGQAMFYFSPSDPSRQTMDDLVRSMVVQLGGQEPRISLLYDAYQSAACERPPLITLLDILRRILRSYDEVFLHLDGLDECPFSQDGHCWIAGELSNWMKDNPNVRMCLTSRDLVEIQQLVFQTGAVPLALDTPDTMPDIRRYVAASLHHHPNLSKLPPTIRITIENELTEKSNGMFLWAVHQLKTLEKLETTDPNRVLAALAASPASVEMLYSGILDDVPHSKRKAAQKMLEMIAYAESKLSFGALIGGLGDDFHAGMESSDTSRDVVKYITRLVTVRLVDLLVVDDDDHHGPADLFPPDATITLQHFSILQFLESGSTHWYHLDPLIAQAHMAQTCLVYLSQYIEDSPRRTEKDLITYLFLGYACRNWYLHYRRHESDDKDARAMLILTSKTALHDWLRVHQPDRPDAKPFANFDPKEAGGDLYYACCCGLESVVRRLLGIGRDVNVQGGHYGSPLNAATAGNHIRVMELLLEGGASIGAAGGVYDSAIQVAATYGHIAATKLLLTFGADDLAQASSWMTASVIAGRSGYAEIAALITHNVRPLVRMP